jgi:hypothetical protein
MIDNSLPLPLIKKQVSKDGGSLMDRTSRARFIYDTIQEYKDDMGHGYYIDVHDLSNADKLIFLSHILDACDYEYATTSKEALEATFNENSKFMQSMLDAEAETMHSEDMAERGMRCAHHYDNGEPYWVMR